MSEFRRRRPELLQQGRAVGHLVAQFAAIDDEVDGALVEQEFGTLEAFGQGLAHRLLDDPRPAKPIRALGSAMTTSPTKAKEAETPPWSGR